MGDDDKGVGIIAYRVEEMEKRLESLMVSISSKLDKISDNQSQINSKLIQHEVQMGVHEKNISELQGRTKQLEQDVVVVRISMAEKVIPGAVAGGSLAALIELLKYVAGA